MPHALKSQQVRLVLGVSKELSRNLLNLSMMFSKRSNSYFYIHLYKLILSTYQVLRRGFFKNNFESRVYASYLHLGCLTDVPKIQCPADQVEASRRKKSEASVLHERSQYHQAGGREQIIKIMHRLCAVASVQLSSAQGKCSNLLPGCLLMTCLCLSKSSVVVPQFSLPSKLGSP